MMNHSRPDFFTNTYARHLQNLPIPCQSLRVTTSFGSTHVIMCSERHLPALVLLHGNLASALSWLPNLPSLSRTHCLFAVDIPGEPNRSDRTYPPRSREDYTDWLKELLDGLSLSAPHFAGLSKGGFLVVNFSLRFPDRTGKLVLLSPGLPLASYTLRWMLHGMPMTLFPSERTVRWFIQGASTKRDFSDPVKQMFIAGITAAPVKIVPPPRIPLAELKKVSSPILLLIGEQEILYQPKAAIRQAKQVFFQVQAKTIPNAGHFLNSDQPEPVNRSILEFLAS